MKDLLLGLINTIESLWWLIATVLSLIISLRVGILACQLVAVCEYCHRRGGLRNVDLPGDMVGIRCKHCGGWQQLHRPE